MSKQQTQRGWHRHTVEIRRVKARRRRGWQGVLLSLGAPIGWALLRWAMGVNPLDDLSANPLTYAYMLIGTAVAFGVFGARLGRQQEQLENLSFTDELTKLSNARHFAARLSMAVKDAHRHTDPVSLMIIDLDHFKNVNDTYGHPTGDIVLQKTAEAVTASVRSNEMAARIGGEELAVLLPRTSEENAVQAAERIRQAIKATTVLGPEGEEIRVTASLGVACMEPPELEPAMLYRCADRALYAAKRSGRDRVCS